MTERAYAVQLLQPAWHELVASMASNVVGCEAWMQLFYFHSTLIYNYQDCFPIFCCISITTARLLSSVINKSATNLPKRSAISTSSLEKLAMVHGTPPIPFTTFRASPEESLASFPTYLQMDLLLDDWRG
jgi:hypothetical protein